MDLRKFADTYGGIPLFIILTIYFINLKNKNYIEYILLSFCIIALIIDIYLSFIYYNSI